MRYTQTPRFSYRLWHSEVNVCNFRNAYNSVNTICCLILYTYLVNHSQYKFFLLADGKMELTDPYERQLLAVFESCDVKGTGRLDCDGLTKLCDQLHLEDGRNQLMDCLLPAFTFHQFRDALLALLGASRRHSDDADREPSPGQYSS